MTSTEPAPAGGHAGFAAGSTVEIRDEEWLVRSCEAGGDGWKLGCLGLSELVRDVEATFYTDLEERVTPLNPERARLVRDDSPGFRRTRLWLEATLRKTPVPLHEQRLTVAHRMLADDLGYQRSAVARALSPEILRPRLLIADAVGLGKTLEIGMILAELARRGRAERVLVVTPRHVLEQMQHELWTRFAIPLVRLDSDGIQRVRRELPSTRNPFTRFKKVIVSVDTLKSERYRAHLEKHRWDAVVIDEAHNLSNSSTLNHRLATVLAPNTDALILASATPHNGKAESFANLVRLLDPTALVDPTDYKLDDIKHLFVRRHRHSPDVAAEVGHQWAERREPRVLGVDANEAEEAVFTELAETWLYAAKPPVSGKGAKLFPWTLVKAMLSSPKALEQTVSNRLATLARKDADRARVDPDRDSGFHTGAEEDGQGDVSGARATEAGSPDTEVPTTGTPTTGTPDTDAPDTDADRRAERAALERLRELARRAVDAGSSKVDALVEHLRRIGVGRGDDQRVVVFTERLDTLTWLRDTLPTALDMPAEAFDVLNGRLRDSEQLAVVDSFKRADSPVRVLLAGDVASEGVNLHAHCHDLVHFDIPWSLIRIEQRNGRIDRYGQSREPRIVALALTSRDERLSGDVRVLSRLLDKEHHAHKALGDAASLLKLHSVVEEEKAIRAALVQGRDLDDVVPDPAGVDDDLSFAELFDEEFAKVGEEVPDVPEVVEGYDLFASEVDFLRTALYEAFGDPAREIGWTENTQDGTVEFTPPADLRGRLDALPQDYLAQRKVRQRMVLAHDERVAKAELARARDAAGSGTSWPQVHYLGPLHPVLDWAVDKALSRFGRNEVPVVTGSVDAPVVVGLGTLSNRRGQVVLRSLVGLRFSENLPPMVEQEDAVLDLLREAGIRDGGINTGAAIDTERWQPLVPRAIAEMREYLAMLHFNRKRTLQQPLHDAAQRIREWRRASTELAAGLPPGQRAQVEQRVDRHGRQADQLVEELMARTEPMLRVLAVIIPREETS